MREVVVAVFDSARAAVAAIDDLEIARIPTARVRHFGVSPNPDQGIFELRHPSLAAGDRVVAVTVDDRHVQPVKDILDMQGPKNLTEAPLTPG
jgi:hypothetical protein